MTSVILELLEGAGEGSYLHGKLCFPEWAPEVRERVRRKFAFASCAWTLYSYIAIKLMDPIAATLEPLTKMAEPRDPEMDVLALRVGDLMCVSPRAR